MYLLTLHDGRRALYAGRTTEGCFFVRVQGERTWWWIPAAMVARAIEMPDLSVRGAA